MAAWSDDEMMKLIELWGGGEDSIQRLFECSHRNKDVYKKIARDMEAAGYTRSQKQISSKLKKLKYEYRRIKDTVTRDIVTCVI